MNVKYKKPQLADPKSILTVDALHKEVEKVFIMADHGITKIICSAIIGNRLSFDPIWLMIVAPSSGGKSLEGNTKVILSNGTIKKAKDIIVGDLLMGDDSKPRTVLATHSGEEMMYRIKQFSGDNYTVNESHILSLKYNNRKREYKNINKDDTININLIDYLKKSKFFKKSFKGFKVRANFKQQQVIIDPYYLSIWLGDGHVSGPIISNPDPEIKNYIASYAKKIDMSMSETISSNGCPRYNIIRRKGTAKENKLWQQLIKLGVVKEKHIPDIYKINSRKVRLEILAGLLDTDGYLDERQRFQFSSKSKRLAEDVVFVARSLGMSVNIYKTIKTIKSKGFSGTYWAVNLTGPTYLIPTRIKRKQAKKRKYKKDFLTTGIKVKKLKKGRYYGFKINGNGRFLLGDFTVTHNTEFINAISGISFVHSISDLTVNTFASGMKKTGKETSLLLRMNNGVMAFKDFTSILSKNKEAKKELMGQLREIYDGRYDKHTGTGDEIKWRGKVGAVAGTTEAVYRYLEDLTEMGDRFIMYSLIQPDRKKAARRAFNNTPFMHEFREHLQQCFKNYIEMVIEKVVDIDSDIKISEEVQEELFNVSDFTARVRSAVITDFKSGAIEFVPAQEMPQRIMSQLRAMASTFIAMHKAEPAMASSPLVEKGELTDFEKQLLFKTALDSIPRTRRDAIYPMAQHTSVSSAGLAAHLNLPTASATKYLYQLNALGICDRRKKGGAQGDYWILKQEYKELVLRLTKLPMIESDLEADGKNIDDDDEWDAIDQHHKEQEIDEEINPTL